MGKKSDFGAFNFKWYNNHHHPEAGPIYLPFPQHRSNSYFVTLWWCFYIEDAPHQGDKLHTTLFLMILMLNFILPNTYQHVVCPVNIEIYLSDFRKTFNEWHRSLVSLHLDMLCTLMWGTWALDKKKSMWDPKTSKTPVKPVYLHRSLGTSGTSFGFVLNIDCTDFCTIVQIIKHHEIIKSSLAGF